MILTSLITCPVFAKNSYKEANMKKLPKLQEEPNLARLLLNLHILMTMFYLEKIGITLILI